MVRFSHGSPLHSVTYSQTHTCLHTFPRGSVRFWVRGKFSILITLGPLSISISAADYNFLFLIYSFCHLNFGASLRYFSINTLHRFVSFWCLVDRGALYYNLLGVLLHKVVLEYTKVGSTSPKLWYTCRLMQLSVLALHHPSALFHRHFISPAGIRVHFLVLHLYVL